MLRILAGELFQQAEFLGVIGLLSDLLQQLPLWRFRVNHNLVTLRANTTSDEQRKD